MQPWDMRHYTWNTGKALPKICERPQLRTCKVTSCEKPSMNVKKQQLSYFRNTEVFHLKMHVYFDKAPVTHSLQPVGDLLATKISGGRWEVAGWLQGRRSFAEGCRDDLVTRRFWLLQVKPLCNQIDRRKGFDDRRQVADGSPTGCRPISKMLQSFCYQKQTLKIQSPTSRRPIGCRSLPNWSPTDCRRINNHCPITRHYSINTRSLIAPEPMLDLFSVSSRDINLKAISWGQFYKRYFKHRSLNWLENYSFYISFKSNYRLSRLKYTALIYVYTNQTITQK